jgi:hypothetical protein
MVQWQAQDEVEALCGRQGGLGCGNSDGCGNMAYKRLKPPSQARAGQGKGDHRGSKPAFISQYETLHKVSEANDNSI